MVSSILPQNERWDNFQYIELSHWFFFSKNGGHHKFLMRFTDLQPISSHDKGRVNCLPQVSTIVSIDSDHVSNLTFFMDHLLFLPLYYSEESLAWFASFFLDATNQQNFGSSYLQNHSDIFLKISFLKEPVKDLEFINKSHKINLFLNF